MENRSKIEVVKPVRLKAGIPMALTLSGYILARIVARKASSRPSESHVNNQESHRSALESSVMKENSGLQQEILGLRSRIQDMQDREWQLEKRFLYCQQLKDQEMVLIELQNKFMLEMNRVEFLGREVSSLDAENQRFGDITVEYLKVLRLLESSRSENEQLHKTVEKLLRKTKKHSSILRKQKLQIESKEREVEVKADCIRLMEDEIKELRLTTELLQEEKNELSKLIKVEGELVTIENYNHLACDVECVEKDKAVEVKELLYLRWHNACLTHELARRNEEQEQEQIGGIGEIEAFGSYAGLSEYQNHVHSRRRKLIGKLKRWVEGSKKTKQKLIEKKKHENKCFPRHSAHLPARKSRSSV